MIVYITTLLTSIAIAKIGLYICKNNDKNKWIVAILSSLPFILISTIRYDVGSDYFTYMSIYKMAARGVDVNVEWLYVLINRICYSVSNGSYVFLLFITAVLYFVPLFLYIFYYSPKPILSITLVMIMVNCFYFFNGMRQMISASFILISLHFIDKRKPFLFALCILIAGGFHSTSYIFGVLYFIKNIKLSRNSIIVIILIIFIFNGLISERVISIIDQTQYSHYIRGTDRDLQTIRLLINVFIMIFYLLFFKNSIKNKYSIYLVLQIISIYSILLAPKVDWAQRIAWTTNLPSVVFLPIVIDNMIIPRNKRIAVFMIITLFTIYTIYYCYISGMQDVFPYQTSFGHLL